MDMASDSDGKISRAVDDDSPMAPDGHRLKKCKEELGDAGKVFKIFEGAMLELWGERPSIKGRLGAEGWEAGWFGRGPR